MEMCFFFKVLLSWPTKTLYKRVVFSEKSGKMYILPSTTFVAFWRVSLLCCFLPTWLFIGGDAGWGLIYKGLTVTHQHSVMRDTAESAPDYW
jgi:hypothetical protein